MLRRVFRLYPLSIVVVLAVWLFSIPAYVFPDGSVYQLTTDPLGLLANLLLVQDVVWSAGGSTFIGVLWTLPIELEMYLLLPVIFLVARRLTSVWAMLLAWCGSAVLALGVTHFVFDLRGRVVATFDWGWLALPRVFEFLPCFLAGVVAYVLWRRLPVLLPYAVLPVLLGGIIATWFGLAELGTRGSIRLVFGMVACLAVGLLLPMVREPESRWVRVPCATVARYSYGIYLVHVPCIWLGFGVLGGQPILVQWLVTFGATLAVSFALYHLVEQPGIRLGTRLARRWSQPAASRDLPLNPKPSIAAGDVAD
jgi:peptidoglycan/LPS O-acetylase OafA/YrhL